MQQISFKAYKDKEHLRFSIPDKSVRDEFKKLIEDGDILIVEVKEIIRKGKMLRDVPVRGGEKNGRN